MATDVARLSFDPARHFTGVAAQQGRVTLEAEQNEQRVIDAEERRHELLDLIGPGATPNNGYALSAATGSDFTIGAGTMYVGGLRVALDAPILYSSQPDWLDHSDDPDWVVPNADVSQGEHVVLVVTERDVTAVEDPALREVALGGADGSARTILLQHIERKRTQAQDCVKALNDDEHGWLAQGLRYDPATAQLSSESRLLVSWVGNPELPDPCEPGSAGGYLGAENQLLRIQITAVDRVTGAFDLVWGWDNASFLYRVTADASTDPKLTLDRSPADDYHRPRAGQAVQVLRSAAELRSTDAVVEGYVAALHGEVGVLTSPYDPDTKTVQFPAPLPGSYTNPKQTDQLYLRVWEERLTGLAVGTPIELTGTGVAVTISVEGTGPVHDDDYWCIGVRPATSTAVYPERYLRTPQPPDGPRQWAIPLAVIHWDNEQFVVTEDCRHHFGSPEGTDGCCTIELGPSDVHELQRRIDVAAANRVGSSDSRITICLRPGRYELEAPITLAHRHSHLTLRSCSGSSTIAVAPGFEKLFGQGLIVMVAANDVTIEGLDFELPQVPAALAGVRATNQQDRTFAAAINAVAAGRWLSIGIRPVHCAQLVVRHCLFRFSVGEHLSTPATEQTMPRTVFGIGVFAASEGWGLTLEHNRFLHDPAPQLALEGPVHALVGYLLTPTAVAQHSKSGLTRQFTGGHARALLHDAVIRDNIFDGISAALIAVGDLGTIRIWDNIVRRCYTGIWLLDAVAAFQTDLVSRFDVPVEVQEPVGAARSAVAGGLPDPLVRLILVFGQTFPLPDIDAVTRFTSPAIAADEVEARQAAGDQAGREGMARFVDAVVSQVAPSPAQPGGATADFNAADPPDLSPFQEQLSTATSGLAALGRLAGVDSSLPLSLRIERNDIACGLAPATPSGSAVFVQSAIRQAAPTSSEVSGNRISSTGGAPTTVLASIDRQAVTGNIIASGDPKTVSLAVVGSNQVAITGNILSGPPALPARPFPAPLDTWLPLNTVV